MTGCWLPDELLVPWERALLASVQAPTLRLGRPYWNLDTLPPAHLRALSWPRRAMELR
jgi:hypothetical protein